MAKPKAKWRWKRRPTHEDILALGPEVLVDWIEAQEAAGLEHKHIDHPLGSLGGGLGEFDPAAHTSSSKASYYPERLYKIIYVGGDQE